MRIISKFHDYYDTALGFGLDPERVYLRAPRHVKLPRGAWPGNPRVAPSGAYGLGSKWNAIVSLTLGFCGKHWPIWVQAEWPFDTEHLTAHDKERHWLTPEEAIAIQTDLDDHRINRWSHESKAEEIRERVTKHARQVLEQPEDARIFRLLNCPVYVVARIGGGLYWPSTDVEIITNPRLLNLGFEKERDAYGAFQDIATFLANDLTRPDEAPLTTGGDEVVARAKGFDEASFRTAAPGAKKLNRKTNRLRKQGKDG